MTLYAIQDASGAVLRVDEAESPPTGLEPGCTANALPPGMTPAQCLLGAMARTDAIERRWRTLKAERDRREFGGFTWDGSRFDSDSPSQARLQGAAQMAQLALIGGTPFSIEWTLADNTTRTLSATDMIAVGMALAGHITGLHAAGRLVRQALHSAATVAQVHAVNWPD